MNPDTTYQRLGELVVTFQWLENLVQQIAWVLIDPDWKDDPRKQTANLWFARLRKLVTERFVAYVDSHDIADAESQKTMFLQLMDECKLIADNRNRIIHSTFVELKAGGELLGLLRSKIKAQVEMHGNETLVFDQDHLDDQSLDTLMVRLAHAGVALGHVHRQLIHWHGRVAPKVGKPDT